MSDEKTTLRTIELRCPFCEGTLVIDPENGMILDSQARKAVPRDFDTALGGVQKGASTRDDIFRRAVEHERSRPDLLSQKFEQARRKNAEGDADSDPLASL